MSQPRLAIIQFVDGGPSPDQGLPGGGYPSQGLPNPGRPVDPGYGGGIVPPGHIATLPVFPFDPTERPDNSLPGGGSRPDNSLPGQIKPGAKFIVKWLCGQGLILVPDNSLPTPPETPDQSLPETPEPK